jgi:hypothetical protein
MADDEPGCKKLTLLVWPTEKLFQSMTALDEVWVIESAPPEGTPIFT